VSVRSPTRDLQPRDREACTTRRRRCHHLPRSSREPADIPSAGGGLSVRPGRMMLAVRILATVCVLGYSVAWFAMSDKP
jgi:hypothetical protein